MHVTAAADNNKRVGMRCSCPSFRTKNTSPSSLTLLLISDSSIDTHVLLKSTTNSNPLKSQVNLETSDHLPGVC